MKAKGKDTTSCFILRSKAFVHTGDYEAAKYFVAAYYPFLLSNISVQQVAYVVAWLYDISYHIWQTQWNVQKLSVDM